LGAWLVSSSTFCALLNKFDALVVQRLAAAGRDVACAH
jgi:hypothetical protein